MREFGVWSERASGVLVWFDAGVADTRGGPDPAGGRELANPRHSSDTGLHRLLQAQTPRPCA